MSNALTRAEHLAAIRGRVEGAIGGRWTWRKGDMITPPQVQTTTRGVTRLIFNLQQTNLADYEAYPTVEMIAHAPADLAWLLAEVERLEAALSTRAALGGTP